MKVKGDRLSNLSDDLIHNILSYVDIKQAIETSSLSSRWRYIWTKMPSLNFSDEDFHTSTEFSKFVTYVLSRRNNQIEVSSVKLTFYRMFNQSIVKRILDYAVAHNVRQLNISFIRYISDLFNLPAFLFRLEHLKLSGSVYQHTITTPSTWELPNLTTLNLRYFTLRDDNNNKGDGFFSNFANLKNLTLNRCTLKGLNGCKITHHGLVSLTLENGFEGVNVVTPQLKNLTIKYWRGKLLVSAPNLSSLCYKDHYGSYNNHASPLQLLTDILRLEKADICMCSYYEGKAYTRKIVRLLQQLRCVKFLTLNLELIKLLSSYVELISHQPSPFVNLKSLKIYPADVSRPEVVMSTEIKNYLLDGSLGATLTIVSHEESRAAKKVRLLRYRMTKLRGLIIEWKENSETNTDLMKQGIVTVHEQGYKNTYNPISMLQEIEGMLAELPTSHRVKLQASFSGLRAEVETMMDNTMNRM